MLKRGALGAVRLRAALFGLGLSCLAASAEPLFDPSDQVLDRQVERCLATPGVTFFESDQTLCYNAPIFPEQFFKLNEIPAARHIILTSPGGNVATARLMSTILDTRDEPAIIAGPCMSACAMVLLPGLNEVGIHRTAHIAVHGITMMDYRTWFGWRRDGQEPNRAEIMAAQLGYDFDYVLHQSGRTHMRDHLEGQAVDIGFIQSVSDRMYRDASGWTCRLAPKAYWGMLDADHLRAFLGDRLTRLEAFAGTWSAPENTAYKDVTLPISDQTYVFKRDLVSAGCR